MDDALNTADRVIADILAAGGKDYSTHKMAIAKLFNEYLWNGNWDMCLSDGVLEDGLPNLRFIQEDEYDQHMDDDRPEDEICFSGGHYIFEN